MARKVFIDGEAGTTGLEIRSRLSDRSDIELLSIDDAKRKDPAERARLIREADAAVLCLPDDAARESAQLAAEAGTAVIDASTAHRVDPDWAYGFAEVAPGQRDRLRGARQISNPGCYPTGYLALVRPLVYAGLLPTDARLSVHAVSGYTGGGKSMIAEFEASGGAGPAYFAYGLSQAHKHLPEMQTHSGLASRPVFTPSVAAFDRGMLVCVPLALEETRARSRAEIVEALSDRYGGEALVTVSSQAGDPGRIDPRACRGTDKLELSVFGDDDRLVLTARLDNLGKGASGAAVQNLNLALGLPETAGLRL